jgi:hypothetical protein
LNREKAHVRFPDKSEVESNITQRVVNGDEYTFITAYERQKYIRVRDVRLGLNPIELLPEKTDECHHFGVMQSKATAKVHESAELPRRYRSFKHVAVPKFSKVEGGVEDVPLVEAYATTRRPFSPTIPGRLDFGTVSNLISTSPAITFLCVRESHSAAV